MYNALNIQSELLQEKKTIPKNWIYIQTHNSSQHNVNNLFTAIDFVYIENTV